jgi:class 3 adenylate cyclase
MRAGLACGLVILLEGDDYVGGAVNLAARLCDRAEPDQVLAAVAGLIVPESVVRGGAVDLEIPGFAETVAVVALATRPRTRRVLPLPRIIRSEEAPPSVDAAAADPSRLPGRKAGL